MRLTLALTAALLLVGAGCSGETKLNSQSDTPPPELNRQPDSIVDLQATSSNTITPGKPTPGTNPTDKPVACTMDAKACPDGSFVGRTGPNCEFAACPIRPADQKPQEQATKPVETKPTEPTPTPSGPKSYTLAEVKAQAAAGKCWTIIEAKVYDLSSWITKHPGGEAAIRSLCGIDGTAKFKAMHAGAAKPEATLASFQVGVAK